MITKAFHRHAGSQREPAGLDRFGADAKQEGRSRFNKRESVPAIADLSRRASGHHWGPGTSNDPKVMTVSPLVGKLGEYRDVGQRAQAFHGLLHLVSLLLSGWPDQVERPRAPILRLLGTRSSVWARRWHFRAMAMVTLPPFAPEIVQPAIDYCINQVKLTKFNTYVFKATFNPTYPANSGNPFGWVSPCYYDLDQGPLGLMIENCRTGLL